MLKTRRKSRSVSRSHSNGAKRIPHFRRFQMESLEPRLMLTGTWTALAHAAPAGIGTMELLSDGTVIGTSGKNWYKLTPDSSGSYVNGTWSTMASMSLERCTTPPMCSKTGACLSSVESTLDPI